MTDIAYKNHPEDLIRIMVDNICYKSNVSFNVENMTSEEKSTGLIHFKNVMKFTSNFQLKRMKGGGSMETKHLTKPICSTKLYKWA